MREGAAEYFLFSRCKCHESDRKEWKYPKQPLSNVPMAGVPGRLAHIVPDAAENESFFL